MTSTCVPCVGSSTNVVLTKSFLLYFAVLILLELVTIVGSKIGWQLKHPMEFCLHPVSEVWHLFGGSHLFLPVVCAEFCNTLISLSIWICCNISSIKTLAMKNIIGKESAVIDTKIVSEKV